MYAHYNSLHNVCANVLYIVIGTWGLMLLLLVVVVPAKLLLVVLVGQVRAASHGCDIACCAVIRTVGSSTSSLPTKSC
jgi:hypothetical protein